MPTKKRAKTKHEIYSGNRLKQFRRKRNWTRDDLEIESAGEITARTIFNWENEGIPANVQKKKIEAVCNALGITLEDLEKIETEYLQELTLDIVQERLEKAAAEDMKANEIVKIVEFINKRQEAEPYDDIETVDAEDQDADLLEEGDAPDAYVDGDKS